MYWIHWRPVGRRVAVSPPQYLNHATPPPFSPPTRATAPAPESRSGPRSHARPSLTPPGAQLRYPRPNPLPTVVPQPRPATDSLWGLLLACLIPTMNGSCDLLLSFLHGFWRRFWGFLPASLRSQGIYGPPLRPFAHLVPPARKSFCGLLVLPSQRYISNKQYSIISNT